MPRHKPTWRRIQEQYAEVFSPKQRAFIRSFVRLFIPVFATLFLKYAMEVGVEHITATSILDMAVVPALAGVIKVIIQDGTGGYDYIHKYDSRWHRARSADKATRNGDE